MAILCVNRFFSEGEEVFRLVTERIRSRMESVSQAEDATRTGQVLSKLLAIHAALLIPRIEYDQAMILAEEAVALGKASGGIEGQALGYFVWGQAHNLRANSRSASLLSASHPTGAGRSK